MNNPVTTLGRLENALVPSLTPCSGRVLNVTVRFTPMLAVILLLLAACRSAPPQHPKPAVEQKNPSNRGTIHVADFLASPKNCGIIHGVRPAYPKEATRAHIEGVVKLIIIITKTGEVGELHLVSGDPA